MDNQTGKKFRSELKFFMNVSTAHMLRRRVAAIMKPDRHSDGLYIVNNYYLDDRYDTCYNEKQVGSFVRDKYRIRFYNDDLSFIRFENKHKEGELSYKDTAIMTEDDFNAVNRGDMGYFLNSDEPLRQKVANLHRLRQLRVASSYTYTREAYVYEPGNVRITFDSNIRVNGLTPEPYHGAPPGAGGMMEVKFDRYLPSVIKEMLDGLPLIQTAMSKYCYSRDRCV